MDFDWQPFAKRDGAFASFDNPGDQCVGKIVGIRTHDFGQGKGPVPLIDVERQDNGEAATIVVSTIDLMGKVADIAPQVGDMIAVKLIEFQKVPGRPQPMKIFAVKHKVGERKQEEPEWDEKEVEPTPDLSEYSEEPF